MKIINSVFRLITLLALAVAAVSCSTAPPTIQTGPRLAGLGVVNFVQAIE